MRTLPIKVPPLPGEALDSWLEAIACRYDARWGDLLAALSIQPRPARSTGFLHSLDDDEIAAISYATGVAPENVQAMLLTHYDGRAVSINPTAGRISGAFPWGKTGGSRFCPHCLAETGGRWRLAWRLGWTFACLQHHCLLADRCPRCHHAQRHYIHCSISIPSPGLCTHPLAGTGKAVHRCHAPLARTPVVGFPVTHPVLRAQHTINEVIACGEGDFGIYAPDPQPSVGVFADVRSIAYRILNVENVFELDRTLPSDIMSAYQHAVCGPVSPRFRPSRRLGWSAPAESIVCAVAVTLALHVLDAPDPQTAGDRLRSLLGDFYALRRQSASPERLFHTAARTPPMHTVALFAAAPRMGPCRELRYRIGHPDAGIPARHPARFDVLSQRVPSLLWPEWSARFATPRCSQRQLQRVLPVVIMIAGCGISISVALARLGSPLKAPSVSDSMRTMRVSEHWNDIRLANYRLADYLAVTQTPINYERRRHIDYRDLLTADDWPLIRNSIGLTEVPEAAERTIRAYLYQRISCLPAEVAGFCPPRSAYSRSVLALIRQNIPELHNALDDCGQRFLRAHGIRDEPIAWCPDHDLLEELPLPGDFKGAAVSEL